MNRCPLCNKEIPLSKTYCSRECAAQGWKKVHSPILGKERRLQLARRGLSR